MLLSEVIYSHAYIHFEWMAPAGTYWPNYSFAVLKRPQDTLKTNLFLLPGLYSPADLCAEQSMCEHGVLWEDSALVTWPDGHEGWGEGVPAALWGREPVCVQGQTPGGRSVWEHAGREVSECVTDRVWSIRSCPNKNKKHFFLIAFIFFLISNHLHADCVNIP